MDRIQEQFPPGTAFQFSSSETKQQLSLLGRLLHGSPDEEDIEVLSRFVAFGVEGMAFFEPGYHKLEAATWWSCQARVDALEIGECTELGEGEKMKACGRVSVV